MQLDNPRHWLILVGVLIISTLAVLPAIRLIRGRTYHFVEVNPGILYRDGLRNPQQFLRSCRRGKIRTVISLVGKDEIDNQRFAPAMSACRAAGIQTRHVPVHISGWPGSDDVQAFLTIAQDPAAQPVIVHCREGIRRTGMMVAAYQLSVLGYTKQQAREAMQTFGHSARTVADIDKFIELYDPASRTITYPDPTCVRN